MSTDRQDLPEFDGMDLVMPFVVCQSQGGPYEDDAFVAGFQAGQIDRSLRAATIANADRVRATVMTALVPQLELLAMQHGFLAEITPWPEGPESWSFVTFKLPRGQTPDDAP